VRSVGDGMPSRAWLPPAVFVAAEFALLAAAHAWGGPPWVAIGAVAVVGQVAADLRPGRLGGFVPALCWLAAHHATGNRELFFPYSMALAVHLAGEFFRPAEPASGRAAGHGGAVAAGGAVVAAFLAIRRLQNATPRVLGVEAAVAALILAAAVALLPWVARRPGATWALTAAASLAAYAGLAV
jgi:hypothetical protein